MGNQDFTILIADDEEEMLHFLADYITNEGYTVLTSANGKEMIDTVNREKIDLILLDIMMPVMDGMEALRELRSERKIPVIMITARADENDRVEGLKRGADDYIVKPFSPRELLARIEAQIRRNYRFQDEEQEKEVQIGSIQLKYDSRKVFVDEELIQLTRKEFDLLSFFMAHPEQVFNREQLLDQVWGMNYTSGGHRTVDTHMKTLRHKLKKGGEHFKTVYGVGYVLEKGQQNET
ncbi:response regulator transcription factor [Salisediminibacterium halotolerans]|uniref:DNA-binding response regulator, OmpR family, contains REC and winged-helix (WHTH) domain n=1 Tax=Salisediminibacterium halotolerans TaxID=517425 RepID=A0A1H9WTW6_9BACI|nr:response regulator transcription factor [Salisediminibacterium haloalkalitolerans]SES37127.1 DNA-binding response regulator, OmpR family, contains REC and winged-helix (wHTH) domain [Salisediminibacterium haloalkalitolerans]